MHLFTGWCTGFIAETTGETITAFQDITVRKSTGT